MTDRNFDDLAARFERNLYQSPRGRVRLQLVSDALLEECNMIHQQPMLRVLDVGCGMGQMTQLLASHGHQVFACDVSAVLLERAMQRISHEHPEYMDRIQFQCLSLQSLPEEWKESFDLVIFHAVLEWLAMPQVGLQSLKRWLKPEGELSLLFYNRNSLIFKNLLRGNFQKIATESFSGDPGSLTPINPLEPCEVEQWLADMQMDIVNRRGIRTFYEYMDQTLNPGKAVTISLDEIIRWEKIYGLREPYRSLGRYQLWHCKNRGLR